MFRIAKVHADAQVPVRACAEDAGLDLVACEDAVVLAHGGRVLVDTGIAIQIPSDCYGRVAPRSGMAVKHGIQVGAGVVDAGYRGSIRVLLFNHGDQDVVVQKGDRIAQLIFERIYSPQVEEVSYEELSSTDRGSGGFGSTGTH